MFEFINMNKSIKISKHIMSKVQKIDVNIVAISSLAIIVIIGFLSVRTVLTGGEIAGWGHSFHFTYAYLTYYYFMPDGFLLGYDSWHMFGWSPNMYYNPGTTYFVAFTYKLLSLFTDFKTTYNLCVILSYLLLAPALYLFSFSLTKSRLVGLLSALASLTIFDQENPWTNVGWRQIYYIGMWPQRMGLVNGIFATGLFILSLKSDEKRERRKSSSCCLVPFLLLGLYFHMS